MLAEIDFLLDLRRAGDVAAVRAHAAERLENLEEEVRSLTEQRDRLAGRRVRGAAYGLSDPRPARRAYRGQERRSGNPVGRSNPYSPLTSHSITSPFCIMHTQQMLSTHPSDATNLDALVACINACFDCEQCCTSCADACLHEDDPGKLTACIRTNLDCADVCAATGRVLSRIGDTNDAILRAQLEACKAACDACADECAEHKDMHEHCRICMSCCRDCSDACTQLLQTMGQTATA